ncbi:hypothetical protein EON67_01975 [archaeon]|nr:MAG: hypothetical protein EON67_01975 [archaeon]
MSGYNSEGYNGVSASEGGGDVGVSVVPPHSHFTSASSSSAAGGLSGSPSAPRTALHVTWWIVFLFSVGALVVRASPS